MANARFSFELKDMEGDGAPVKGFCSVTENGIEIKFEGFSTVCEPPESGTPILVENRDGIPVVIVWSDIRQEDPTHLISLKSAESSLADESVTAGSLHWVGLRKSYYLESDPEKIDTIFGAIPLRASTEEVAIKEVLDMIRCGLQTGDERIVWLAPKPGSGWTYKDWSFDVTGSCWQHNLAGYSHAT